MDRIYLATFNVRYMTGPEQANEIADRLWDCGTWDREYVTATEEFHNPKVRKASEREYIAQFQVALSAKPNEVTNELSSIVVGMLNDPFWHEIPATVPCDASHTYCEITAAQANLLCADNLFD